MHMQELENWVEVAVPAEGVGARAPRCPLIRRIFCCLWPFPGPLSYFTFLCWLDCQSVAMLRDGLEEQLGMPTTKGLQLEIRSFIKRSPAQRSNAALGGNTGIASSARLIFEMQDRNGSEP